MNETIDELMKKVEQESQSRAQTLERLVASADASKVFSPPVTSGEYTVITAAEVAGGGGFGSGMGFGSSRNRGAASSEKQEVTQEGATGEAIPEGAGGGGGGGGGSTARPVAVIVIGPEGVDVRPIVDLRRVGITLVAGLAIVSQLAVKVAKKR